MKKISSVVLVSLLICISCFSFTGCSIKNIPQDEKINLDEFNLVFEDNFDGNSVNYTKWKHNPMKHKDNSKLDGIRRACYYTEDQVTVKDGNLHITTSYDANGPLGSGWYTGWLESSFNVHKDFTDNAEYTGFSSQYGYYEIRCICPPSNGIWSAFWLMPDNDITMGKNDEFGTATDGCEIDIMESPYFYQGKSVCQHVFHIDGYGSHYCKEASPKFKVKDMYSTYHTYGMLWTPEKISFYIDGWKTYESTINIDGKHYGVPQVAEYMILSVEVGGHYDENGNLYPGVEKDGKKSWAGNPMNNDLTQKYDFIIDHVKVYQK